MIKYPKTRKQVKQYLIIVNISLGLLLFCLLVFGLFVVRSNLINKAVELKQQILFDINQFVDKNDNISPSYIGDGEVTNNINKGKSVITSDNSQNSLPQQVNKTIKPKLAIIVTNLGLNRRSTELALLLPKQFALGFLPYTNSLKPLLYKAQEKGTEIYLYLPCETNNPSDNPGKHSLGSNLGNKENLLRLSMVLNLYMRYNGIYTSYKEEFTHKQEVAEVIIDKIIGRNLIFLVGKEKSLLTPKYLLEKQNILNTNVVIDSQLDEEAIKYNLKRLIASAKKNNIALGYAGGYPLTINILNDWFIKQLDKEGIELVPVSSLLKEANS
jgi:polysaccharide deacetylase 2 family uncharacterized protein YibQ